MNEHKKYNPPELKKEEWATTKCDRYDFLMAAFCGAAAGLIDIFFVGIPSSNKLELSKLGALTDGATDKLIKKYAKMVGWKPRAGQENNVASAIGFFERKFKVNYDQKSTKDVNQLFNMSSRNHHFKSLSHSPDPVGLFFSILDQFMNTSSFLSDGKLIRIDTTGKSDFELKGTNLESKLFCGFCNWLGHIMSDIAGSSGNRGPNSTGRGMGVSLPFMELFQLCDFGSFTVNKDRQTLAIIMTRAFQKGYDVRFGAAMAIPVLMEELMIRVLWVIRQRYFEKKPWHDCIPDKNHADLRLMLIVGNATLCLFDGTDAAIHAAMGGGNALTFVLHFNIVAWARLIILVFKELQIRYGPIVLEALKRYMADITYVATPQEQKLIKAYYFRMQESDETLDQSFYRFTAMVEREYNFFYKELSGSFSDSNSSIEQVRHSVILAEACNVPDEKIMKSKKDMDNFFRK